MSQNPGNPSAQQVVPDRLYTAALRTLVNEPTDDNYARLQAILPPFVRTWPIYTDFFSLDECGLDLTEIAYFNAVRCRTAGNATPNGRVAKNCRRHLKRWVDLLKPKAVIFIGVWGENKGKSSLPRPVPTITMRRRSKERNIYMTSDEKEKQRREAAAFVLEHIRPRMAN